MNQMIPLVACKQMAVSQWLNKPNANADRNVEATRQVHDDGTAIAVSALSRKM